MKHLLVLLSVFLCKTLFAQNAIGLPAIVNYDRSQYQGNGQTWDIDTDSRGILYFANNEGLLSFNGTYWQLLPVPNSTRLRSVKTDSDGRIYVGAQDDFGYYLPDSQGILQYTSLKKLIPAGHTAFADIWNIALYNHGVYFRSNNKIFEYRDHRITVYDAPAEWKVLCSTPYGLYAQDLQQGLYCYRQRSWQRINTAVSSQQMLITAILQQQQDTLLIATLKNGFFRLCGQQLIPLPTAADSLLYRNRIYCAIPLANGQLAAGTFSGGCYIIDSNNGKIIQQFTRDEGLQNNNVLKLFTDRQQNIWLALDNGIDLLHYNTAIKRISPDNSNLQTTYAARIFQHRLYIGTSDGLFSTPLEDAADVSFSRGRFQPVNNTKGQVWHLSVTDNRLMMGHHEGAYEIKGNTAVPLLKDIGCWRYLPAGGGLLAGCYNGLAYMRFNDTGVRVNKHLSGLYESLRFLAPDGPQHLWSSHPYRGVYRLVLSGDTALSARLYTQQEGLPSNYNNYVFSIRHQMVVATRQGIYEFDSLTQRFHPSPAYQQYFGHQPVEYLTEDSTGNIWFVAGKQPGVIDAQLHQVVRFPELAGNIINGFIFIYPYNRENIFFGAEKGMLHLNYRKYTDRSDRPAVWITEVKAHRKKDSLLQGGYAPQHPSLPVVLPNSWKDFHFRFSSPVYNQDNNITYRYQLRGFEKTPGAWTGKTEKEYTNLPPGKYTFVVQAKNNLHHLSDTATFTFVILPPWYQTQAARAAWVLLLLFLICSLYLRQRKKFAAAREQHRKEQEQLQISHQLELKKNAMLLMSLKNEKLESDVQHKNRELATATMNLVQKGKLLSQIREEFLQSIRKMGDPSPLPQFKKVLRLFDEAENNEEEWTAFSRHFDEVHNNFLLTLKKQYPELTITDLKLCAFLRLNLTTKEIAQLLGISVRGVETSRYRLRKKLQLSGDTTLHHFLFGI
ncbi:transcriptional regulator [Chitinophaga sp. Mgbs1]|uniref:Transcriptional regulator n=1 Tax=Chitinophaga solisilvae TaxID=1233460 RepID=A0A433WGR1_9BACT|nr:transcriptional regulator [Chitinophaga solisilvae]